MISFSFSWISCLVNVVFLARIKGTLFVKIKFHFHVSFVCIWVHCCLLHGAWWLEVCGSLPNQYVGILWTWRMCWNASKILGSHFSKQVKLIPEECWTSPVLYHLFKCCSSVRATWRSSSTVVSGFCLCFLQMTWFLLVYQAITYSLHWSGWQQNNKQLWWKIFKFETQFKTKVEAVQASDDDASWAPHRWGVSNSLSPWDQSRPRTCWRDVREVA